MARDPPEAGSFRRCGCHFLRGPLGGPTLYSRRRSLLAAGHCMDASAQSPLLRPAVLRVALLAALAMLVACESGCVRRRMTVRSNPPGAKVYVDDIEIGTTPVSTNF